MAAAARGQLYRGSRGRADTPRDTGGARTPKPLSLQPRVQAILRRAPAPISHQPSHRTCQTSVAGAQPLGDRYRVDPGLQRDERLLGGVPEGDRSNADELPSKPGLKRQWRLRDRSAGVAEPPPPEKSLSCR